MTGTGWTPIPEGYAVDTSGSTPRLGEVTRRVGGNVFLRPLGGGTEWNVTAGKARQPSDDEWTIIRAVTTPVPREES